MRIPESDTVLVSSFFEFLDAELAQCDRLQIKQYKAKYVCWEWKFLPVGHLDLMTKDSGAGAGGSSVGTDGVPKSEHLC